MSLHGYFLKKLTYHFKEPTLLFKSVFHHFESKSSKILVPMFGSNASSKRRVWAWWVRVTKIWPWKHWKLDTVTTLVGSVRVKGHVWHTSGYTYDEGMPTNLGMCFRLFFFRVGSPLPTLVSFLIWHGQESRLSTHCTHWTFFRGWL